MATMVGVSGSSARRASSQARRSGAETPLHTARIGGVDGDDAQRPAARGVAVVLAGHVVVEQGKGGAQPLAVVVVAAEHVDRDAQRREQLADALVLVAGCPWSVRSPRDEDRGRAQRRHVADGVGEQPLGLRVVVVDVHVAQLDEEERLARAHAVVVSGR